MSLTYSFIDPKEPIGVPPRKVNGGLYTGKPFEANAAWGNVAIVPEAHLYAEKLKEVAPPQAANHIPGYTRKGNNTQVFPNHTKINSDYRVQCLRN